MSRKKRRADRIRMHLRAFEGGEDQYGIRMTTGRMGQEIARLKRSLALRDRRMLLIKKELQGRIRYYEWLIAGDEERRAMAQVKRELCMAILLDIEIYNVACSSELDMLEKSIAKRTTIKGGGNEEVSDV